MRNTSELLNRIMECCKNFISLIKIMAEVLEKQSKQKAGVAKTKKSSLRVDLTPMVDLGFLLISFFIFTTSISQPTVMKLAMPDERDIKDSSISPENKTLNIILGENNEAYVYNGTQLNEIQNVGPNIREAVMHKKNEIRQRYKTASGMVVLIKPTPLSTYENVVNALDEMLICDVKAYMLVDASNEELGAINQ